MGIDKDDQFQPANGTTLASPEELDRLLEAARPSAAELKLRRAMQKDSRVSLAAIKQEIERDRLTATNELVAQFQAHVRTQLALPPEQQRDLPSQLTVFVEWAAGLVFLAENPFTELQRLLRGQRTPGRPHAHAEDRLAIAIEVAKIWAGGPRLGGVTLEDACEKVAPRHYLRAETVRKIYKQNSRLAKLATRKI